MKGPLSLKGRFSMIATMSADQIKDLVKIDKNKKKASKVASTFEIDEAKRAGIKTLKKLIAMRFTHQHDEVNK